MTSGRRAAIVATMIAVSAVTLAALPLPLMDDQVLFLLGARVVNEGGMLYRDYWDIKPPGIFLHYLAAGRLFGFDAVGLHLFELLWMLALGVVMWLTLRRALGKGAVWAACLTSPVFYLMADEWWMGLLEPATWLPLFLTFAALTEARRGGRAAWLVAAGAMGGVVGVYKPLLGMIPAALVLAYLGEGGRWRRPVATVAWLLAGLAVPVLAIVAWFARRGALGDLWDALVVFPGQIAGNTEALSRINVLIVGITWFLNRAGGLVALGAIGLLLWWFGPHDETGAGTRDERQWIRRAAVAWCVGAVVAVMVQVQSWWDYHWLLLVPALAMLGADAMQRLGAMRTGGGAPARVALAAWLAVGLAFTPLAVRLVRRTPLMAEGLRALTPDRRAAFQARANAYGEQQRNAARWLARTGVSPGPIYVWGSPLIYLHAGRRQASPIQGWNLELLTPTLNERLYSDLKRHPPVALFVERSKEKALSRDTVITALLAHYSRAAELQPGTWYTRP